MYHEHVKVNHACGPLRPDKTLHAILAPTQRAGGSGQEGGGHSAKALAVADLRKLYQYTC